MKKIFILLVLVVICSSLTAFGASTPKNELSNRDLKLETIEGQGMVYISLNLPGLPSENMRKIFGVVEKWKKDNEDKEITSFQCIFWQCDHKGESIVYGVVLFVKTKK